ncbi:hypothetical protein REPUB_Repub05bG0072500 [Reevesia pubescens]
MSVLFWNSRDSGTFDFSRHARELVMSHNIDVLVIVELYISGNNADKVIKKLHFDSFTITDAKGFCGGIWMLWKKNITVVTLFKKSEQFISVLIIDEKYARWTFIAVYANLFRLIDYFFWNYLKEFDDFDHITWLFIGELNQITSGCARQRVLQKK